MGGRYEMKGSGRPGQAQRPVARDSMDRRRYARIQAPLRYRPIDTPLLKDQGDALDISLGGARIHSTKELPVGALLWLEIVRPDGSLAKCRAKVMWATRHPRKTPAQFEIGVRFMAVEPDALKFLIDVLKQG
jgi:PilZ domain-containing protein